MCCRLGGSRHLISGALTSFGVRRGRMGDKTRMRSGDLARSSFVTMSADERLASGEVMYVACLRVCLLDASSVLCAESLRGAIADSTFAGVLYEAIMNS